MSLTHLFSEKETSNFTVAIKKNDFEIKIINLHTTAAEQNVFFKQLRNVYLFIYNKK